MHFPEELYPEGELRSPWASLIDLLTARACERSDDPAYAFLEDSALDGIIAGAGAAAEGPGVTTLTYRELDARARAIGVRLAERLPPGERVLLLFPPGLDFVSAFFGCLYAGIVAVPVYPPTSPKSLPRLRAVALDAGAGLVLTVSSLQGMLQAACSLDPQLSAVQWLATDQVAAAAQVEESASWQPYAATGDTPAFLQYTSGSTAAPKGVRVGHGHLLHNQAMIQQAFGQSQDSIIVGWLPLYHDMGLIGNVLQPLYVGARCYLMSPMSFLARPLRWPAAISHFQGTTSGGPNFAYDLCSRKVSPEERVALDLSCWQVAFNGAEPVRAATLERFAETFGGCGFERRAFVPCYGLAEATLLVTAHRGAPPPAPAFDSARLEAGTAVEAHPEMGEPDKARRLVGCGPVTGGQRLVIVDPESRRSLPDGAVGEIWISGPSVAGGYWRQDELNREVFAARLVSPDGASEEEAPFLRTGDLGFQCDGGLFVTGRIKDLLILRGRNLYPQDLEVTAEAAEAGLRPGCSAAFTVPGEGEDEVLILVVEMRAGEEAGAPVAEAIRRAVTEEHGIEVATLLLLPPRSVPKTSSGKVRRSETRSRFLKGRLEPLLKSDLDSVEVASSGEATETTEAGPVEEPPAPDLTAEEICRRAADLQGARTRLPAPDEPLVMDSLAAMEIKGWLEEVTGRTLPLEPFFESPSAERLVEMAMAAAPPSSAPEDPAFAPAPAQPETDFPPATEPGLSYGQQALWFLERLTPGTGAYHVSFAGRLRSAFDPAAFARAWQRLAARHESLRTVFPAGENGVATARVLDQATLDMEAVDAREWDAAKVARRLGEAAAEPFDLERGPLFRFRLFQAAQGPILLVVFHHIIIDLWSLVVLAQELAAAYPAEVAEEAVRWPTRAPRYAAFVERQRKLLEGPRGVEMDAYWQRALEGVPPVLEMPTDRPRPAVQDLRGRDARLRLTVAESEGMRRLAQAAGTTPFVLLMALYQTLLFRLSGQDDLLVGSPAAGRSPKDARLVGFLVNTLPVRGRMAGDPSFLDHLAAVRRTVLEGLEHQDYPFVRLVEQRQPERDAGRSPVIQTLMALHRPHRGADTGLAGLAVGSGNPVSLAGVELQAVTLGHRATQMDLELEMAEVEGRLFGVLHGREDLFDHTTLARMIVAFRQVLASAVANPRRRLSQLPLLAPAQRQQLVCEWPVAEAPNRVLRFLHQGFRWQAARRPGAPAIVEVRGDADGGAQGTLSYSDLAERVSRLAERLRQAGVAPEQPVAVALSRSPAQVTAFLAVLEAGGFYVPLDPDYPPRRLAYMLETSGARVVVTRPDPAAFLNLEGGGRRLIFPEGPEPEEASAEVESLDMDPVGLDPANSAYAIFTSGSTGRPKGVVLTHRGLTNLALAQARAFQVGETSRVLSFAALSFDASVSEMAMALVSGAALCLAPAEEILPGDPLRRLLRRAEITHITLPPSALGVMGDPQGPDEESGLQDWPKVLVCAGEALPEPLAATWAPGRRLLNAYGPTETTVCASLTPWRAGDGTPAVGRPLEGLSCRVLDPRLRAVPTAAPGELMVGGVGLARGYLGRPALTARRFVPDPFSPEPGARLYRTGDRARWRRDGSLVFEGRIDDQVKVRGHRVEPGEAEAALLSHPAVAEAAVVARPDLPGGVGLAAYAVVHSVDGAPVPDDEALRRYLRERLPEYLMPAVLMRLETLPRTPSGKVDRRGLPAPRSAPRAAAAGKARALRNDLERAVAEAWQEVLAVEHVGPEDNFFDLGGHSLLVPQIQPRLEAVLGRRLSTVDLFRYPTVRALVGFAEGEDGSEGVALARRKARERSESETAGSGAVAVVGMACRFPGAQNPEELWRRLREGYEAVRPLTDEEVEAAGVPEALRKDPAYVAAGIELADIDRFDAGYFGLSAREALTMDPQQRFFLECALESLEDAGCDPDRFDGAVGVFAGAGFESYLVSQLGSGDLGPAAAYQLTVGNLKDFLASRVAYHLDLAGPAVTVQTACSTSLVAVHLACRSLLSGESDLALAGGVSIEIPQRAGYLYQPGMILSPDGHCRPFDAAAGGTVRGSGVGLVALKRLEDALANGDRIRAVIRGSAINNDGRRKVGYTAPSVDRQAQVIAEAMAAAGVDPDSVSYIEAHGTGTELGDPIEVEALDLAFPERLALSEGTSVDREDEAGLSAAGAIKIGSIKSNLGHLDTAAGVAGLIKTVLALERGELPPTLHFETPNPKLELGRRRFRVNDRLQPWTASGLRRAGVSSFGIGGTNAHVVVEEAPAVSSSTASAPSPWQLLVWSAYSETALDRATEGLGEHLANHPELELRDVAYTLQRGRRQLNQRRILVSRDRADAAAALGGAEPERILQQVGTGTPMQRPVAFLFPGQGAQHTEMIRGLYRAEPEVRRWVDRCLEILEPLLESLPEGDLRALLLPAEPRHEEAQRRAEELLTRTDLTQPALFTVQYALARWWQALGVEPEALLGHSIGEWTAACLAGVFELEDALALVAERGRRMAAMEPGSMLSVALPPEEVEARLAALPGVPIEVAAVNGPTAVTVAGPTVAIEMCRQQLQGEGVSVRALHTSHAFHSASMEPALEGFRAAVAAVPRKAPERPFLSNVTGTWIRAEEAMDPAYWAEHLRRPVLFAQGVETLLEDPSRILLEVGPGRTLTALAGRIAAAADIPQAVLALPSQPHPRSAALDHRTLLEAAGRLWLAGVPVALEELWRESSESSEKGPRIVTLPTYPFDDQRYWQSPRLRQPFAKAPEASSEVRSGRRPPEEWTWAPVWLPAALPAGGSLAVAPGETCLVWSDGGPLAAAVVERLRVDGARPLVVQPGTSFRQTPGGFTVRCAALEDYQALLTALERIGGLPRRVLHLWSLRSDGSDEARTVLDEGFRSLLRLGQALSGVQVQEPIHLLVAGQGIQGVAPSDPAVAEKAALLGPAMVLGQEIPHLRCRVVDVDEIFIADPARGAEDLLAELAALGEGAPEAAGRAAPESLIAYRPQGRWRRDWAPLPLKAVLEPRLPLRRHGVYLITGGLGGLGKVFARYLAGYRHARVVLVGRSGGAVPEDLKPLIEQGAEVMVAAADVADPAAMADVVVRARQRFGALHGIFHAAGVAGGGILRERTDEKVASVLGAKLGGARNLEKALEQAGGEPLELLVLFSSLAASVGGFGQVDYSAANAALEVFAEEYGRRHPRTRCLSIAWGAWAEVGMAARGTVQAGDAAISPEDGVKALERILDGFRGRRVLVSPEDFAALERKYRSAGSVEELAEALAPTAPPTEKRQRPALQSRYIRPVGEVEKTLVEIWQDHLGIEPLGVLDNFFELGGTSLTGIQVVAEVKRRLGVELPAVSLYEGSTVRALSEQMAQLGVEVQGNGQSTPPDAAEEPEPQPAEENPLLQRLQRGERRRQALRQRHGLGGGEG